MDWKKVWLKFRDGFLKSLLLTAATAYSQNPDMGLKEAGITIGLSLLGGASSGAFNYAKHSGKVTLQGEGE